MIYIVRHDNDYDLEEHNDFVELVVIRLQAKGWSVTKIELKTTPLPFFGGEYKTYIYYE